MSVDAAVLTPKLSQIMKGNRLNPRASLGYTLTVLVTVLAVGVVGFAASFQGLLALGAWAGFGVLAFTVPIVIDGSIIVFSMAAALQRNLGLATKASWAFVGAYTFISIVANAAHVVVDVHSGVVT